MSKMLTFRGVNDSGFDENRHLLVVPVGRASTLFFVDDSVLGTAVTCENPEIATLTDTDQTQASKQDKRFSPDDRSNYISKLTIKGIRTGRTTIRARRTVGYKEFTPIEVQVVNDANARQAGAKGAITPELREELQRLSLREAVLRVAEDQMFSKIGRNSGGFGMYANGSYDWCGAFAHFCWKAACEAQGKANPFGSSVSSLLSAQKAISWALQTDSCAILRYEGGDPYGSSFTTGKALGKAAESQRYIEISATNPVLPGDICIVREKSGAWKHVCMVRKTPDGETCLSIDGNQGSPCIQFQKRSMRAKTSDNRNYLLIFLHVLGVD